MAVIDPSAVWDFAGEIVGHVVPSRATTTATVTRVDPDGTTWVTTGDGGEAPASSVAAGVSVGDTVTLEWDGSAMGIRSNVSNPAPSGSAIRRAVDRARGVASAAQHVADAVNQHFFADTSGIHVTEATQDEWEQSHSGANVLINSIGQLFRDGLNNLLTLTTENGARALTIWDGLGNTADHIRAIIGETIQLGNADSYNITIQPDSIDFNDGDTKVYSIKAYTETVSDEYETTTTDRGALEYGSTVGATIEGQAQHVIEEDSTVEGWHNRLTLKTLDNHKPDGEADAGILEHEPYIELHTNRWTSSSSGNVSDDITFKTDTWIVWDLQNNMGGTIDPRSYPIESHDVAIALRHPEASYTGASGTITASTQGWKLTAFDSIIASVGLPGQHFQFFGGVIRPVRNVVVEISAAMHWQDAVAGQRGFGIFNTATPGSGTEYSLFNTWEETSRGHKLVVYPPRLFTMTAGSSWSIGRWDPNGAIFTTGRTRTYITIRVVG